MQDKSGREYAKLSALNPGDRIELDSGFTCAQPGYHTVFQSDDGLYFRCTHGRHYLKGQCDDNEYCIGIYIPHVE